MILVDCFLFVCVISGIFYVRKLEHKLNEELNNIYLKLHDLTRRRAGL